MASTSRPPGARFPSDAVAAAGRPSRATRAPRRRPGEVERPLALYGAPSPYERMMFEELRVGLSAAAGSLDAVHLAEACRNLALVHDARGQLAVEGLTVEGEAGPVPHPLVRVVASLGGLAHRQLQALGLLSLLLDRASVGEGLADRLAAGAPDEFGCVVDGQGRRWYAGVPKPSAKVVPLRRKKAAKPSQTLRRVRSLAAGDVDDEALRLTWQSLPAVFAVAPRQCGIALEDLTRAQALAPGYGLPKALAAWCRAQRAAQHFGATPREDLARALRLANEACALAPSDPLTLTLSSGALTLAHRLAEADRLREQALAHDPLSPIAWLRRGWTSAYYGDASPALREFTTTLLRKDPSLTDALAMSGPGAAKALRDDLLRGKLDRVALGGQISGQAKRGTRRCDRRAPEGRSVRAFLLALVLIALAGCSGSITDLEIDPGVTPIPPGDPAYETTVQIRYLGAGGVLIKRGADSLLTAPFFSNPSIPRVILGELALAEFKSRPEQVDRFLSANDEPDLAGVTAVLVGHAHYDHLMDLPYIKRRFLPRAKIYGSDTMKYTLAGERGLNADDVFSVERGAWEAPVDGKPEQPGKWWYASSRLRFMALKSEHAPVFWGIKFWEGDYREPLQELPTRPSGWREGQTLAYLIDFLGVDGRTVDFRIHYQDTASNPPYGFAPLFSGSPDQRDVDVAILCMPGFGQVMGYPQAIIHRTKARAALLIHWEDFFALLPDDPHELRTVPTLDAQRFIDLVKPALKGAPFKMPAPGAWLRYAP